MNEELERRLDALLLPRNPEARVTRIEQIVAERNELEAALAARPPDDTLAEALEALHAEVEMAESIGICLPDRVPSLRAGELLAALRANSGCTCRPGISAVVGQEHEPQCALRAGSGDSEPRSPHDEMLRAERDEAIAHLRAVVKAVEDDAKMGYPLPGESCVYVVLALGVDEFLSKVTA